MRLDAEPQPSERPPSLSGHLLAQWLQLSRAYGRVGQWDSSLEDCPDLTKLLIGSQAPMQSTARRKPCHLDRSAKGCLASARILTCRTI